MGAFSSLFFAFLRGFTILQRQLFVSHNTDSFSYLHPLTFLFIHCHKQVSHSWYSHRKFPIWALKLFIFNRMKEDQNRGLSRSQLFGRYFLNFKFSFLMRRTPHYEDYSLKKKDMSSSDQKVSLLTTRTLTVSTTVKGLPLWPRYDDGWWWRTSRSVVTDMLFSGFRKFRVFIGEISFYYRHKNLNPVRKKI